MESIFVLIALGLLIGTFGTLIGAGGGFILVPILILFYPEFPPEITTAISIAVVAVNSISGSFAYAKSGRIDYKAGITFALYTIPGSILGVLTVQYLPQKLFNIIFGIFCNTYILDTCIIDKCGYGVACYGIIIPEISYRLQRAQI